MPDLSQLEQIFSKVTPGKEVELYRAHVEWRKLKNQTVNDPAVVEAKAAAEAATTDLEKRNGLRHYYELFYARMRALAPTPEMVAYLDSQKTNASRSFGSTARAPHSRHWKEAGIYARSVLAGAAAAGHTRAEFA